MENSSSFLSPLSPAGKAIEEDSNSNRILIHRNKLADNENFRRISTVSSNSLPSSSSLDHAKSTTVVAPDFKTININPPSEIVEVSFLNNNNSIGNDNVPSKTCNNDAATAATASTDNGGVGYNNNNNKYEDSRIRVHPILIYTLELERNRCGKLYSMLRSLAALTKIPFEDGMVYLIDPYRLMICLSESKEMNSDMRSFDTTKEENQRLLKTILQEAIHRAIVTPYQKGCVALDRLDIPRYCAPLTLTPSLDGQQSSIGGNIEDEEFEAEFVKRKKIMIDANNERDTISKKITQIHLFNPENKKDIEGLQRRYDELVQLTETQRKWFETNRHRGKRHPRNISFGLVGNTLTENIKEILREAFSSIVNDDGFVNIEGDLFLEDFLANDCIKVCFTEYTAAQYRIKTYAVSGRNPIYMERDQLLMRFLQEHCFNKIVAKTQDEILLSSSGGRLNLDELLYHQTRTAFEKQITLYMNHRLDKKKKKKFVVY